MAIRIPILMYHGLATAPDSVPAGWSTRHTLPWNEFKAQISLLRREGWRTLLPHELTADELAPQGERILALTFDDGHASDLLAAEHLAQAGMRATFYITWSRLGRSGYLARGDAGRIARQGLRIGAHGLTHVAFTGLDDERLWRELHTTRVRLEDLLGTEVSDLACPFGAYDQRVLAAAFKAGYRTIMTSDFRRALIDGGCVFSRLPVFSDTSLRDFGALLHEGPLGIVRRRILAGVARRSAGWAIFAGRRGDSGPRAGVSD